jgi:tRNA:m(5)U-54 methyltransferase
VIGAGFAGVEAAYYLLKKGYEVDLYEMRPKVMTPAHRTGDFAELVCSNSLRSDDIFNGVGLLKHEMRQFDSITMKAAEVAQVPAGSSLAVDRTIFSHTIHSTLTAFKNLTIMDDVFSQIDENIPTIIATGPLTHDDLMTSLGSLFNKEFLHFFDAVSPILDGTTINMDVCYLKSRYDKGDADYINCPMDKETYLKFYDALMSSDKVEVKDFENNAEYKQIKEQIALSESLINNDSKAISKAYHKAKKDGSNPELVEAVESIFIKEQKADEQLKAKVELTLPDNPPTWFNTVKLELGKSGLTLPILLVFVVFAKLAFTL